MPKSLTRIALAGALAVGVTACQPLPTPAQNANAGHTQETETPPAAQQDAERQTSTLAFAQGACGDCHAVEADWLSPNPKAPAFANIANRTGITAQALSYWLRNSHNFPEEMDFDLDGPRVDALTAYILTLRDPDYKSPAL